MSCIPFRITLLPSSKPKIMTSETTTEQEDARELDVLHGDMRLSPLPSGSAPPPTFTRLLVTQVGPLNLSLSSSSSTAPKFFVTISIFSRSVPHITLHSGPDKLGAVLGVAHLSHCSTNTIGLGDPQSDALSVIWETLARTSRWSHATYRYEFLCGEQGRTAFVWQRSGVQGLDDQAPMYLYEEGKPDVVLARFECNGFWRWRKRGAFVIHEGLGDGWALMALLTGLSLLELARRRAGQRRRF